MQHMHELFVLLLLVLVSSVVTLLDLCCVIPHQADQSYHQGQAVGQTVSPLGPAAEKAASRS